ncbi:hypothetical protein [Ethanoligenens sp.]|uniref:hypothetical protein n=1 Tax=Ethanoligenens sp. TaxID=2099655 RepID=UPI0039E9D376
MDDTTLDAQLGGVDEQILYMNLQGKYLYYNTQTGVYRITVSGGKPILFAKTSNAMLNYIYGSYLYYWDLNKENGAILSLRKDISANKTQTLWKLNIATSSSQQTSSGE